MRSVVVAIDTGEHWFELGKTSTPFGSQWEITQIHQEFDLIKKDIVRFAVVVESESNSMTLFVPYEKVLFYAMKRVGN